jgi:peptidoglycan/xylan/chitin deacetylase (PgdA/CDA1 family)
MNQILITILIIAVLYFAYYVLFSPWSQILGKIFYKIKTTNKLVALTFDDGPNEPYTSEILDVLQKYNVKATFFPVGQNIVRFPKTLEKIDREGHVVGIHSYNHALLAPILTPKFEAEISKSQKLICGIIGKKPTLFRPPWYFRQPSMLGTVRKAGMVCVTGTFGSTWEVFQVNAKRIASDALKVTKPGTILTFHDGYNNKKASRTETVEALKMLLPKLQKDGYKFVTVPELLAIKAYQD